MYLEFKKNNWSMEGLIYAGSARFPAMPDMEQREDFIENIPCEASNDGYAYISLVTEEKVQPGVKLATRCAFEDLAAPLIVLPRDMYEKDGYLFYSDYLEVVLWTNGINVWKLWKDEDGQIKVRNLLRLEMPVERSVSHDFAVEIEKDRFNITLDDNKVSLYCDEIYDSFHLGITGCEGPCRFYDMEIQKL
jgi:hypothetical protein